MYPFIDTSYSCKYDFIYLTTLIGSLLPSDTLEEPANIKYTSCHFSFPEYDICCDMTEILFVKR